MYLYWAIIHLLALVCISEGNVCDVQNSERFDCFPEEGANEQDCVYRGCCWRPPNYSHETDGVPLNIPYCYYGQGNFGYQVKAVQVNQLGFSLMLSLKGHGGQFGNNIKDLKVDAMFETDSRVHVKIYDPNSKRYEVPVPTPKPTEKAPNPSYTVKFSNYPFGIYVVRKNSTSKAIFDTRPGGFVFSDQFIQISSMLPSHNIYGLGEHVLGLKLDTKWTKLSLFSRDIATPEGGVNLYGVHPFYLNVEEDGRANGVFLKNSNAMDIILQPTPAITYRTIGGILDFYIFMGPTPNDVVEQLNQVIGTPTMPPYWSLGFHLCRYGYNSIENMRATRQRMKDNQIPQDVQWNDIDYMDSYRDFTIDNHNFHGLPEFVKEMHGEGMHYVAMTDPAISTQRGYEPFEEGVEKDVFIKDHNNEILVGKVWPGLTAYPDFYHPNASEYWYNQLNKLHNELEFDGIWIDMNEPSCFVDGSSNGCPKNNLNNPPFVPSIIGGYLPQKTICMDAKQAISSHYNLHSLYGHSEAVQTMSALQKIRKKRSLVITRSSYTGTGHHAGHWLGDNHSSWEDLYRSIAGILNFNMFGIPMVGADICGFLGDTNPELCARWMQLGAFYPFSRNHNDIHSKDQDPAVLGDQVIRASKGALEVRYTLLPYLNTLFARAFKLGSPVARPLFFQYPKDSQTYGIDTQFMWGDGLLISPVVKQGASYVDAYFPKDRWYEYYTGAIVNSNGQNIRLPASFEKVNLHIRGGTILPTQKAEVTTTKSRMNPFELIVALDESGSAKSLLFLDDGEQILHLSEKDIITVIGFSCKQGKLITQPTHHVYTPPQHSLSMITVLGVESCPSQVTINGKYVAMTHYENSLKKLTIKLENASILEKNVIKWV